MRFFQATHSSSTFSETVEKVVTCVSLSLDASTLAYGGLFGVAVVKRAGNNENKIVFQKSFPQGIETCALSSDGGQVYVGELKSKRGNADIQRFDISGQAAVVKTYPFPCEHVWSIATGPQDELMVAGGKSPNLARLYHVQTGAVLCDIQFPSAVKAVAIARPASVTLNLSSACISKRTLTSRREKLYVFRDAAGAETLYLNMTESSKLPRKYRSNKKQVPFSMDHLALPCCVVYSGVVQVPYSSFGQRTMAVLVEDFESNRRLEAITVDPKTEFCKVTSRRDVLSEQQNAEAAPDEEELEEPAEEQPIAKPQLDRFRSQIHSTTFQIFEEYMLLKRSEKCLLEIQSTIACISELNVLGMAGDEGHLLVAKFQSCEHGKLSDTLEVPMNNKIEKKGNIALVAEQAMNASQKTFLAHGIQIGKVQVSAPSFATGNIAALALSKDGSTMAVGESTNVFVTSTEKLNEFKQQFKFSERVLALSLTKNGNHLAVGGEDCSCKVLDVASGVSLFEKYSEQFIKAVSLSADGVYLAYGGMHGTTGGM